MSVPMDVQSTSESCTATEEVITLNSVLEETTRHASQHLHKNFEEYVEAMPPWLVLILLLVLVVHQTVLVKMKKYYYSLYMHIRYFAIWSLPMIIFLWNNELLFCFSWLVYSVFIWWVCFQFRKSIMIPRYTAVTWLFTIYDGMVKFVLLIPVATVSIIIFHLLFDVKQIQAWLSIVLFCGFYFIVLLRGIAEILTDRIAVILKENAPLERAMNNNICCLCCTPNLEKANSFDKPFTLHCRHIFHEVCFQVWCVMGKKRTCPRCEQTVLPKIVLSNIGFVFERVVNMVEYMVAWLPLIAAGALFLCYAMGHKHILEKNPELAL